MHSGTETAPCLMQAWEPYDAELRAWLRLVLTPRIGPGSARKLLAALGSPQAIFDAGDEALQALLGKRERAALAAVPPELDTQFETLLTWLATS